MRIVEEYIDPRTGDVIGIDEYGREVLLEEAAPSRNRAPARATMGRRAPITSRRSRVTGRAVSNADRASALAPDAPDDTICETASNTNKRTRPETKKTYLASSETRKVNITKDHIELIKTPIYLGDLVNLNKSPETLVTFVGLKIKTLPDPTVLKAALGAAKDESKIIVVEEPTDFDLDVKNATGNLFRHMKITGSFFDVIIDIRDLPEKYSLEKSCFITYLDMLEGEANINGVTEILPYMVINANSMAVLSREILDNSIDGSIEIAETSILSKVIEKYKLKEAFVVAETSIFYVKEDKTIRKVLDV